MRHEHNFGQMMQKQFSKTIQLYHPPAHVGNKGKQSHTPCIPCIPRGCNGTPINHTAVSNQYNKVIKLYTRLQHNLQKQFAKFQAQLLELQKGVKNYYLELRKIVDRAEKQGMKECEATLKQYQHNFKYYIDLIKKRKNQISKNYFKKTFQQYRNQFKQLSVLEVPYFVVQGNTFKKFQKVLQQFKPIFNFQNLKSSYQSKKSKNSQKQNQNMNMSSNQYLAISSVSQNAKKNSQQKQRSKQYAQASESTVKKQNSAAYQNYGQAIIQGQNAGNWQQKNLICEFSCDEELNWNPKQISNSNSTLSHLGSHLSLNLNFNLGGANRYDKKQMVSEIIFEEPSSCEDSLMNNEAS